MDYKLKIKSHLFIAYRLNNFTFISHIFKFFQDVVYIFVYILQVEAEGTFRQTYAGTHRVPPAYMPRLWQRIQEERASQYTHDNTQG